MKKFILIVCFLLIDIKIPLSYFNAKFEPPDGRVIHGLGQYVPFFYSDSENWQLVHEYQQAINQIPVIYSVYASIDPILSTFDSTDFQNIVSNHGYPYLLLVGISLHDASYLTGNINIPVNNILSGVLDSQIVKIAQRIKSLNAPTYVRPGFEFGTGNSGIHNDPDLTPQQFIDIWIHIHNVFFQENVSSVAWVWNTVNPSNFNYNEWYPGDQYVDWWGINYFTEGQISSANQFLNDAAAHQKPVMICESCPISNGGTTNSTNWNNWFIPYFNKIRNTPHLKAFVYISDPWDKPGFFSNWPDSRITSNEMIRQNYGIEITDTTYIHMSEYINNPGILGKIDTIAPGPVLNFSAKGDTNFIALMWQNPIDSDFVGVKIVKDTQSYPTSPFSGDLVYFGHDTTFKDRQVENNYIYYYTAYAVDGLSNYSLPSFSYASLISVTNINFLPNNTKNNYTIFKNYPNPFNSYTIFSFEVPDDLFTINIRVYDIVGNRVYNIEQLYRTKGMYQIKWDATHLPSGIYLAKLQGIRDRNDRQAGKSHIISKYIKIFLIK